MIYDYFVIGDIRTCLGVSNDPVFQGIFLKSCPLNLLLVQSHQAEIIIVKRLIQRRNNATRVRVEPISFDHGLGKTTPLPSRPCCGQTKQQTRPHIGNLMRRNFGKSYIFGAVITKI